MPTPTDPPAIKVVTVEDDDQYRAFLDALMGGAPGFLCAGSHRTAETALAGLSRERPDVLLVDLELPGASGLDLIARVSGLLPRLPIVVLTIHDDTERIYRALENGAIGYLIKPMSPARLLEGLAEAHAGGSPMSSMIARLVIRRFREQGRARRQLEALTPREAEVLDGLARGLQNKEIGAALGIFDRTVATHARHVYEKLHVHNRSAAVARALLRPS